MKSRNAILAALGAALLFGASTPFAKRLAGDVSEGSALRMSPPHRKMKPNGGVT